MHTVIDYAHMQGWRVAHFRPAMNQKGQWRTAVAADGAGFPDLCMVRDRVVWIELKVGKNKPSDAQEEWLEALAAAGQEVFVWRPEDWPEILAVLDRV